MNFELGKFPPGCGVKINGELLTPGVDYHIEDGCIVLSEEYRQKHNAEHRK